MTSSTFSIPDSRLAGAALCLGLAAVAGCGGDGRVVVEDAWSRPAPAGGAGAVYMTIRNETAFGDRLIGAASDVCETVELHVTEVVDDRMRMRHLADGAPVGSGEVFEFAPGGYHVMLLELRDALAVGQRFTLNLEFETAGAIAVEVEVRR